MRDRWDNDWGATASDYGRFRVGFPESFFELMSTHGLGKPGQHVVDLATGPGTLARGFARRGCTAVGIDLQPALLEEARRLDKEAGLNIEYRCAPAENTGLPDGCADIVSSGSSWNWFDTLAALKEVSRLLKKDGVLLVTYSGMNDCPLNTETFRLIREEGKEVSGNDGMFKIWMEQMRNAGFTVQTFTHDFTMSFTHEQWRGHVRAWQWTGATMSPEQLTAFDQRFAALLKRDFPDEPMTAPFRAIGVLARRK